MQTANKDEMAQVPERCGTQKIRRRGGHCVGICVIWNHNERGRPIIVTKTLTVFFCEYWIKFCAGYNNHEKKNDGEI